MTEKLSLMRLRRRAALLELSKRNDLGYTDEERRAAQAAVAVAALAAAEAGASAVDIAAAADWNGTFS